MPRDILVRQVMTTDVVSFSPDESIQEAMGRLVEREIDGGPVVDNGKVVGMLTAGDLIVQDARLHGPTVITLLGATIELPGTHKHFEEDLHKAIGLTVAEVMSDDEIVTCGPDDTVEDAATILHERHLSRLPVVDGGRLVGVIARGDILRAIVQARQQG